MRPHDYDARCFHVLAHGVGSEHAHLRRESQRVVESRPAARQDVLQYLRDFFLRMAATCDLSSPELAVTAAGRGSEFDFPRPSPSWLMIEEFCRGLHAHPELRRQLKAVPVQWF